MSIRIKLIILVIFTGLAGVASFFVNEMMMIPIRGIEAEAESLIELHASLDNYANQANRLNSESFHDQMERVLEAHDQLAESFRYIKELKMLPSVNESISTSIENIIQFSESISKIHESLMKRSGALENTADMIKGDGHYFTVLDLIFTSNDLEAELQDELKKNVILLDSTTNALNTTVASAVTNLNTQSDIIRKEMAAYRDNVLKKTFLIIAIVLIVPLIIAIIIANLLATRIKKIETGISRMKEGDLADRISVNSRDELGRLSKNVNDFTDELGLSMLKIKESSNINLGIKNELLASVEKVASASEKADDSVVTIINNMEKLDTNISKASGAVRQVEQRLEKLENVLEEEIAMIEEVSASVTEMITSIVNVSGITVKKTDEMSALVKLADQGGEKLKNTNDVISKIHDSIEVIGGASQLIAQIAARTNLLAMNASIEAAHAGESGTGFAVVADEIRKLAEASAVNSKRINGVMKEIVENIREASTAGIETDAVFIKIDSEVASARNSFEEISSSMEELRIGGRQILEAMTRLNDFSSQVKEDSDEMRKAASENQNITEDVLQLSNTAVSSVSRIQEVLEQMLNEMSTVSRVTQKTDEISKALEKEVSVYKTGAHIL